jgi:hypothetical protein
MVKESRKGVRLVREDEVVITADLLRATGADPSRISNIASALGIRSRRARQGPNMLRTTTENAVRIVIVRRLQELGLPLNDALAAVKHVTTEDLHAIIVSNAQVWLITAPEGTSICDADGMLAIAAATDGSYRGLRIVNIHQAIRDILAAQLERAESEAEQEATGSKVFHYTAPRGTSGVTLHGTLRLAVFKNGRGHAIQLSPDQARSLAAKLLSVADAAEADPRPEDIH